MPYYDHDKDYPFAAFITNLGKYNEGELVGEWVKFPTTAEELKEVFKRIGIGQKDDFGKDSKSKVIVYLERKCLFGEETYRHICYTEMRLVGANTKANRRTK